MTITAFTQLKLKAGKFTARYHRTRDGNCVSFSYGNFKSKVPVVRIHSACLFGETFGSKHCDCGEQIKQTLNLIKKNKSGAIVYSYDEGRGHGLENKITTMELERKLKIDSAEAFERLNLRTDVRTYEAEICALKDLDVNKKIKLVSANPTKIKKLIEHGFEITERPKLKVKITPFNKPEFELKKRMGYQF